MQYVVLDLEWNQAMSSQASVFLKLPFRLRGEIIQIGAVRLDENMFPADEFMADVKPKFFKRMHYKVKMLTGIDKARLKDGSTFPDAIEALREWCGQDTAFLTWGYDDKGIMEQNLMIHEIDADWIRGWVNLQTIFNFVTEGDKNQKALSKAMEHFEIEQTRTAHDALGDAYNTAVVASKLKLDTGIIYYDELAGQIKTRLPEATSKAQASVSQGLPLEQVTSREYASLPDAFSDTELTVATCPHCGAELHNAKWISKGNRRYMTLAKCRKHGQFLINIKFKKDEFEKWTATRLIYMADEEMLAYYKSKSKKPSRRKRKAKKAKETAEKAVSAE